MSRTGKFFDDLESAFGKGSVTSGYRSQAEQDALIARGATRARRSAHTYNDGYDFRPDRFKSEADVRASLESQGFKVDKVIYETGKGRNQGTGAHWHTEGMRKIEMANGADDYLDSVSRVGQPGTGEDRLAQSENLPVNPGAVKMFGNDGDIAARADRVQGVLNEQDKFLEGFEEKLGQHQATVRAATEEKIQGKQAIIDEIQGATTALSDRVKPIFATRQRIADQLDRINTMNPLERGIRSIFDLNYDQKHLEKQLAQFDATLARRGQDYEFLTGLQDRSMKLLEAEFGNKAELANLDMQELDQDGKMINEKLASAMSQFEWVGKEISQQAQVIQARHAARVDVMESLQGPQILQLLGKSKANGGTVDYNGIPLTAGELQEYADRNELQELQIEGARMARANQKEEMADRFATRLGRSLTKAQAAKAAANGGVYNGVQIPQDVLTQVIASHAQREAIFADELTQSGSYQGALQVGQAMVAQGKMAMARTRALFGGDGNSLAPATMQMANRVQELAAKIKEANDRGLGGAAITALTNEFKKTYQEYQGRIDDAALKYAGGDKTSAGYISAFLKGVAMDSQAGVEAMVHFVNKGSLPSAMRTSPAARAAFKATQSAILATDNEFKARGVKPTVVQRQQAIMQKAAAAIPQAYVQQNMNGLIDSIPQMAQIAGDKFGKISPEQWKNARMNADVEGYELVAHQLGINARDVPLLMAGRYKPTNGQDINKLNEQLQGLRGQMAATQNAAFLRNIDQMPAVVPGQSNSRSLLRFVQSPTFAKMASRYESNGVNIGFGDFLVGSASQGILAENVGAWAQALQGIAVDNEVGFRAQAQKLAKQYSNQPMRRAAAVLGAIPGIDKHQEALLLQALKQNAIGVTNGRELAGIVVSEAAHVAGLESTSGVAQRENDRIASFIKTTRFKDPALEAVRKVAAAKWDDYAVSTDGVLDRLLSFTE